MLAFALVVAGCGSGGSPGVATVAASTTSTEGSSSPNSSPVEYAREQALAYSHCMRSAGVSSYPDPNSNGNLAKGNAQSLDVSTSQYQAAERACGQLLPGSGSASLTQCLMIGDCPRSVVDPALEKGRKFARCMRSHRVPNWPDHRRFFGAALLSGHQGGHFNRCDAFTADALQDWRVPA